MSILDEIKNTKLNEVQDAKKRVPLEVLHESKFFESPCLSLSEYLKRGDKTGIIAEIKRRSPSKGDFKKDISVELLSIGYMQAGAAALSVLTDEKYFGGGKEDLITARTFNFCPILRKDFMIDVYQVDEAKSWGADAILLIAKMISPEDCRELASRAIELGMETLLEVHSEAEIDSHYSEDINIVGVNNRNLDDFSTDWRRSLEIQKHIPKGVLHIAESGLSTAEALVELKKAGFSGFLIGEAFMSQAQPERACQRLIQSFMKGVA